MFRRKENPRRPTFDVRGKGTFGMVRAARHLATNKLVAIKSLKEARPDLCIMGCIEEVLFYTHLGEHPNLVRLLDVTNIGQNTSAGLGIVFEHFEESLQKFPGVQLCGW